MYVEGPYETDSLLSEGCGNPYDERPVGAPPTDPQGKGFWAGLLGSPAS
jgi:hypothetical protein